MQARNDILKSPVSHQVLIRPDIFPQVLYCTARILLSEHNITALDVPRQCQAQPTASSPQLKDSKPWTVKLKSYRLRFQEVSEMFCCSPDLRIRETVSASL